MKRTEQIERTRTEEYVENIEYWLCDDCRIEYDEGELVPVAVDPKTGNIDLSGLDRRTLRRALKEGVSSSGSVRGYSGIHDMDDVFRQDIVVDVLREIVKKHVSVETDCSHSLDICKSCLEEDFGVELEEHNGKQYDEREIEETNVQGNSDEIFGRKIKILIAFLFTFGFVSLFLAGEIGVSVAIFSFSCLLWLFSISIL